MASLYALSDPEIKAAKPAKKITMLADGGGLYLYIRPTGLKSWIFVRKLNGKRVEVNLGSYPDKARGIDPGLPLKEARLKAAALRQKIQDGVNPIEEVRETAIAKRKKDEARTSEAERPQTIKELFRRWKASELEDQVNEEGKVVRKGRKDQGAGIERSFNKDVFPVIAKKHPTEVEPEHIYAIRDRIMKRGVGRTANVCLSNMRQMFGYAVQRKYCLHDPTYRIKPIEFGGPEKTGDRWLNDSEIKELAGRLWHKLEGNRPITRPVQLALLFLLATGCRIGEVQKSKWSNVDFDRRSIHFPKAIRKSNKRYPAKDHDVYLSDLSITLLTELKRFTGHTPFLFPNRKGTAPLAESTITKQVRDRQRASQIKGRAKGATCLELKGGEWTPHDLRRTVSTLVVRLVTQQKFTKESAELLSAKVRSHVNPNPLARVYEHYLYDDEMKLCWTAVSDHLLSLIPNHVLEPWPLTEKKQTAMWKQKEFLDSAKSFGQPVEQEETRAPAKRKPIPILSKPPSAEVIQFPSSENASHEKIPASQISQENIS